MTLIFRKLGYHVSRKTYAPLKKLLTPDNPTNLDNTMWTGILEAEAIWEALLEQGRMHFSQAKDTPFAFGLIANKIGPFKFNEYSKQILQGTFDIESLTNSVEVIDIVKAMRYINPANPPEFDCTLTGPDLREQFKKVKESTASSPTGLHYGHWKMLRKDEDTFEPFAMLISFAFQWGIPPRAWETTVQPVLEKDKGSPKITQL